VHNTFGVAVIECLEKLMSIKSDIKIIKMRGERFEIIIADIFKNKTGRSGSWIFDNI